MKACRSGWYHKENPMSREKSMKREIVRTMALPVFALAVALSAAWPEQAQDIKTPYPSMAPIEQYLMANRNSEIALGRSAAPESISSDAEVLVLGGQGYETAVKGKNGFVCIVQRSWTAPIDDPDFWNPKLRAPICFNPPAARSYLPLTIKKTELVLGGQSKAQMFESIKTGLDKKELPTPEPGAICYMMSKEGYLSDQNAGWNPHLMFFAPQKDAVTCAPYLPGPPIPAFQPPPHRLPILIAP